MNGQGVPPGPHLETVGLVKHFGPIVALDGVDFALEPGIHALLGENGAGKSTLVKCLYGYHRPDAGEIRLGGRRVEIRSPAGARRLGIGLVFQQFTLIPALTVAENIALFLPDLPLALDYGKLTRRIRDLSERYGLPIDPGRRAGTLSLPEQQRVEVLRVLLAGARVLIFDEPTSSLPAQEIDALFAVFRRLRDDGYPVVTITHRMPEVFAVADMVTVMRRGAVVGTMGIHEVDERTLVQLMFGEASPLVRVDGPRVSDDSELEEHSSQTRSVGEDTIPQTGIPKEKARSDSPLVLEGVTSVGEGRPLVGLDLEIRRCEIVGVAGVAGNGQRELADMIAGLTRIRKGRRILFGQDATGWSVRRIRESGVGYVTESPLGQSLIWSMSLEENVLLSARRFSRFGGLALNRRGVREELKGRFSLLGLNLPEGSRRAGTLSGGNAQRFALARELAEEPDLLIALYPTRGLDVPTAATVQQRLLDARNRGTGILLISQDLDELRTLCDRLLVMRDGRIVAELSAASDPYEIGRWMTGGEGKEAVQAGAEEGVAV